MSGSCLLELAAAGDDILPCKKPVLLIGAFIVTAYMKEDIIMIKYDMNFVKALSINIRQGWLGD